MSDIYAEQFLVDIRILLVLRILYTGRVHQCAQRALDLHDRHRSLLYEVYMSNPTVLLLVLKEVRNPSKRVFDPSVVHGDIVLLV